MGRRDFQNTVAEVLPNIIKNEAKSGIGALRFTKKGRKAEAKLYFRGGAVYAIELSTYKPNIVNRLITNEHIKDNAREQVLQRFGNSPTNWAVVPFVLTGQLFPEKPLLGYIKDYFLDAFDELYSWTDVNAEFRTNEEPSIPTVPNADPTDLIERAIARKRFLETEVAQVWNSNLSQIDVLPFRKTTIYDDGNYTTALLLSVADGKRTIGEVAEYLGMSRFNVKKDLFELWKIGIIDMLHPSGLMITNRSPQEIKNNTRPAVQKPQSQSAPSVASAVNAPQPPTQQVPAVSQPAPPQNTQQVPSARSVHSAPAAPTPPVTPASPTIPVMHTGSAVTPNGGGSRIAQLAQQLREELAETENVIQAQKASYQNLLDYKEKLEEERKGLEEKLALVNNRIQTTSADLIEAKKNLDQIQEEHKSTLSLLQ